MYRAQNSGKTISLNVDAGVGTAKEISVPEDKKIDVTKTPNMGKVSKYMITGGALFAIGAILMGKNIIRSGLWGLGVGAVLGLFLSKSKSTKKNVVEEKADVITTEVAGTLTAEYNKIIAFAKANNPLTDSQKARAQEIIDTLKDAGYSLMKKGEQAIAVVTSPAGSQTKASGN